MSGPERELTPEELAENDALELGRKVLGRDLTDVEAESMSTIFKAAAQALKHGFIKRLAEHVVAERADEAVEEFFQDEIHPD